MSTENKRGFIAVPRELFDNPIFSPEPFTELQAFIGLVADATWKPRRVRLARGAVDLQRGQLLASTRFLAVRWRWPEPRVRRFLTRISGRRANDAQNDAPKDAQNETQFDALIDAQATRDGTIITIRNYEVFQKAMASEGGRSDAQNDAQSETQPDTPPDAPHDPKSTQRERTNNIYNYIPLSNESGAGSANPAVVELSRPKPEQIQLPASTEPTVVGTLFNECRKFLVAAGVPDRSARSVVGKWRRDHSDGEIFEAIKRAQREEAQDPIAFVTGCLRQGAGRPKVGAMSAIAAIEGVEL